MPADRVALRDLELIGSVAYTSAVWTRVVSLLAERRVDLSPIVTHRFPLEEFERAFELMENRRGIVAKIVLEHHARHVADVVADLSPGSAPAASMQFGFPPGALSRPAPDLSVARKLSHVCDASVTKVEHRCVVNAAGVSASDT